MSAIFFHGFVPVRGKTTATQPDWGGPLQLGKGRYNCSVWKNRCKDGRPYLVVRLWKQGFRQDEQKVALWEQPETGGFQQTVDVTGKKLLLEARIIQGGLEVIIQPATTCFRTDTLRRAIDRLPIPVLWSLLGLPGSVRPNCTIKSPLRDDDRHPSFSIYSEGRRFRDHGSGAGGDSYEFFKLVTKLDPRSARSRFLELAQVSPEQ